MEKMASLEFLAPLVPQAPLDSEETLLLSMMVRKPLILALDPQDLLDPQVTPDCLDLRDLKDRQDTLVNPDSPDMMVPLVPVDPLDHLARLEKMETMAGLASPETEVLQALRAPVDSQEHQDFQE